MPYRYLEDVTLADVAFEAWGATREEMFIAAADAAMNVMVEDLNTITAAQEKTIAKENESLEMLLFDFLGELVFLKDAEKLALRVSEIKLTEQNGRFSLTARAYGEKINPAKHPLNVDVKAVTLHQFRVWQSARGWHARVILDV